MEEPARASNSPASAVRLRGLYRRVWPLRTIGMGLAALPLSLALHELHASLLAWIWVALTCIVWPQLAYLVSWRSHDPYRTELRNLLIDSAIAGSWAPLIHFNLIPSVLLIATVTADKLNVGVRGLLPRAIPWTLVGIVATGLLTGFALSLNTSQAVALATVPIIVTHAMVVGFSTHRLIHRVLTQNDRLAELARHDDLTGLDARGYWMEQTERLLARHRREGGAVALIAVDIDHFKSINDRHGHIAGDAVLRAVADRIRSQLRADAHAGRIGGDEFVIAFQADGAQALIVAERLRQAVAATRFDRIADLRCTISLGIADGEAANAGVQAWLDAADRALYAAKHAGRNQVVYTTER